MKAQVNSTWLEQSGRTKQEVFSPEFEEIVRKGIDETLGLFVIEALRSKFDLQRLSQKMDCTGVEAFVNSLHLMDFGFERMEAAECFALIASLDSWLDSIPEGRQLRVVISGPSEDAVFRTFLIREDQPWLVDDLESYGEAIFVADLQGRAARKAPLARGEV